MKRFVQRIKELLSLTGNIHTKSTQFQFDLLNGSLFTKLNALQIDGFIRRWKRFGFEAGSGEFYLSNMIQIKNMKVDHGTGIIDH